MEVKHIAKKDYAVIPNRLIERLTNFPTENITIDSEGRLQQTEKLNGIAIRLSNYEFYDLEMRPLFFNTRVRDCLPYVL